MSETERKVPDWLKVITGGKDMPDWTPPQSAKPPDVAVDEKPRKERQHCWHLAGDIDEVNLRTKLVCCTCGMKHDQELKRIPPPGHGYFSPSYILTGKDPLPQGKCEPPHFIKEPNE